MMGLVVLCDRSNASSEPDEIQVVTTIPDLADFVKEIGGELVKVRSITKGTEDMHFVPVRPSLAIAVEPC